MPLFQTAVLNKYLKQQDDAAIRAAFTRFRQHFHAPEIQANIRNSKEEQYQEGFLRDLFVDILGYTLNPQPGFQLTTEFKNEKGSKKADGAILQQGKALAVIELKGTDTTDLASINAQAFQYKANHTDCVYVVTSNFERLRFFIDNAVEHLEFDLFTLTEDQFRLLWLCLQRDNLLGGLPRKVKVESLQEEEQVTKRLYKDYSAFKNALWQDLCTNHPEHHKLLLYKKTQKLLDRFLFVLFGEDKGLLPPNTLRILIDQWRKLTELDEYRPLYERCQKYFGYLNTGHRSPTQEIFAYNGGLFKPDEVLDSARISDAVLEEHLTKLTKYDFGSEVDVNILGHIFEHSLNEIEAITADLEGRALDTKKTKRKKDGVFYTPKYITKYIVENTVGRLCTEKKDELGIDDEEYARGRKGRQKKTIQELDTKLDVYRDWLLSLTICDPACGSGAFLNQALDYLIAEHRYVDELESKLLGQSIVFKDIGDHILERNIYGVDINEESVEIARLSLWLRTATKGRKLNDLSGNIKCGNSLIDDPAVAGAKAFDWKKEFPAVFAKGGFDVVIGNPPYLRVQGLRENFEKESKFFEKEFKSATGRFDIYVLFIERALRLIAPIGKACYILPHKFMVSDFGHGVRALLVEERAVESVIHFGSELVFADASTYTCILTLSFKHDRISYKKLSPDLLQLPFGFESLDARGLSGEPWVLQNAFDDKIIDKLSQSGVPLDDLFLHISRGVVTGADDIFILEGTVQGDTFIAKSKLNQESISIEAALVKPVIMGDGLARYCALSNERFLLYPHKLTNRTEPISALEMARSFPLAFDYLSNFRDMLVAKKVKYKTNPEQWLALHNSRDIRQFESDKIIAPYLSKGGQMTIDRNGYYTNDKCTCLIPKSGVSQSLEFFLGVLNSNLLWYYLRMRSSEYAGGYFAFTSTYLKPFPVPIGLHPDIEAAIDSSVKSQLGLTKDLQALVTHFLNFLSSKVGLVRVSKNLENWPALEFKGFLAELKKAKVSLSLAEEAEWLPYFTEQRAKAQALQARIEKTDTEIDALVYQLYGLTEEEIALVEGVQ